MVIMFAIQIMYVQTHGNPHTHAFHSCCWCIWDFNLTVAKNLRGGEDLPRGASDPPDLLKWSHAMVPATCNIALVSKFCASTRAITSEHTHHECSVAIVLPMLVVMWALASPATTLAAASTYVNNVKIIASFNFHVIPGTYYFTWRVYWHFWQWYPQ